MTSSTTIEPDWSPIRRAAYVCRSASIVSWTVWPLRSGFGSSSLTSLPRAVTSTRWPPGSPRSRGSSVFSRPSLPILTPGTSKQRVLVFLLIFLRVGGPDIADQLSDGGSGWIVAGEAAGSGNARQIGKPDRDRGILVVRHVVGDRHGLEAARFLQLATDALDFVGRQLQERGELGDDLLGVGRAAAG